MSGWARTVAAAARDLPDELASPPARGALERLAGLAPPSAERFGFECRLSPGDHPVDLGLGIGAGAARAFAEWVALRGDTWDRIKSFARRWSRDRRFATWIPFVFLEFDAESAGLQEPIPSVFLALDSPLQPRRVEAQTALPAALQALVLLRGEADPNLERSVRRAHDTLPNDGTLLHVALMLGRAGHRHGARISVAIDAAKAPNYLDGLGGRTASQALSETLEKLPEQRGEIQLDFDVGAEPGPLCGIGLRPDRDDTDAWRHLLRDLADLAQISERKASAALAWADGSADHGATRRRLSHLKLVCSARHPCHAKVYLELSAVEPSFPSPGDSRESLPAGR